MVYFVKPVDNPYENSGRYQSTGYVRFLVPECNIQSVVKGEDAEIKWMLFGYPVPDVRFSFNNVELDMGERFGHSFTKDGKLVLTITNVGERDQGVYEAIASNKFGEARLRQILQLAVRPRLTQLPEETTVLQRSQARLEARITGFPTPQVTWFKDWEPLAHSEKTRVLWREPETAILLVNACNSRDAGLYSISVQNMAGSTTASVTLHIEHDETNFNYQSYSTTHSVRPRNKAFEDFYDIGEEIGRGSQGIVYHVVQRSNGRSFAAKCMNAKGDQRVTMNSELWMMNQLHDRAVVRLYDAYESSRQLILVQELCSGGDVLTALCQHVSYSESDVANVIRQVLWALQYMHTKHIAHLGLTPGDILLSRPGGEEVKLCDFSFARHINPERPERLDYGAPEFVAPEIVNGETISLATDMWSVGVITYLLLSGCSPFKGETDRETLIKIQSGDMYYDMETFARISDKAKDFIAKMLVFSPAGRMDVKQAIKHPWLKFADITPPSVEEVSTDRLKSYLNTYKSWCSGAACRTWFRRRSLSSALEHAAGHLYPREVEYTPPPSPEPDRRRRWQATGLAAPPATSPAEADGEEPQLVLEPERLDENLGWLGTESHYQQGPDTFLVQLRDTGLPSRLREYVKIACERSPYLATRCLEDASCDKTKQDAADKKLTQYGKISNVWWQLPLIHERRRFTDIMDEEMDAGRRSRIDKYTASCDCSGQYVAKRLRYDLPADQPVVHGADEAALELQRQRQMPFFREKPCDEAIMQGERLILTCYAVGDPKPVVQWFRNDVALSDSKRLKMFQSLEGHAVLEMSRVMEFDQGVYKAVARNSVGQAVARWRLYAGDVPGAMDMPDVVDYSDTEVLLRWQTPYSVGNAPVIAYAVQMKQLIDHVWTTVADNISHEFLRVSGLAAEANYHFRLMARNRFGWGALSVTTPTCRTRKQGWTRRVTLNRVETFLADITSLGIEPADPGWEQPLDYDAEDFPVPLSDEPAEQKYNFLAEIHRGEMSLVALCVDTSSSQLCAAKIIDACEANFDAALSEYEALRSLRHQRVSALYDAYRLDNKLVLVMEKLDGADILTYFARQHEYSEDLVATAVGQILDGLQYLHWRGLAHLAIEPDNVVLASSRRPVFKLVDLRHCQKVSRLGRMVRRVRLTPYSAPELMVDEPAFPASDVWSLAVLVYVLLSGSCPFGNPAAAADAGQGCQTADNEMRRDALFVRVRLERLFQEATAEAGRFLTLAFRRGPSKRPACEECSEHRWLSCNQYMLKRRQRAVFFGSRLKEYSEIYHAEKRRLATQNTDLITSFGMELLK